MAKIARRLTHDCKEPSVVFDYRTNHVTGTNLNIQMVDIDKVTPWEKNPRKNDMAVKRLQKLLKIHGQRTPIVVWEHDGKIYKGNTTWKAMKANGDKRIAVIMARFKSEQEAITYAISDNRSGEWAEWDEGLLSELLRSQEFTDAWGGDKQATLASGLTDKEYSSYMLSSALPDALIDVDVLGATENIGSMLIIQFKSAEDMTRFKENVLGIHSKNQRVVLWEVLSERCGLSLPPEGGERIRTTPSSEVLGAQGGNFTQASSARGKRPRR